MDLHAGGSEATMHAAMLDRLPVRVVRYSLSSRRIVYCNVIDAAAYGLTPEQMVGRQLDEFLFPAQRERLILHLADVAAGRSSLPREVHTPDPKPHGTWVEWVDTVIEGDDGSDVLAVGRDVTDRHLAEIELADSEARFRELADRSADVIFRFSTEPQPHFDYLSPSVEHILGYSPSLFHHQFERFLEILDDDGRALVARALAGELLPDRFDLHFSKPDGTTVIGEMQMTLLEHGLQGVGRDVTEIRGLQDRLSDLALRDPLTGLPNRRLLEELLAESLRRVKRREDFVVVHYLDLDGFKTVNDTYGHEIGDLVLKATASRLSSVLRASDVIARIGGDEFVTVHESTTAEAHDLAERITDALAEPISIGAGVSVMCPASVGGADSRTHGRDVATLLAAADAAMYEIKRAAHPPHRR